MVQGAPVTLVLQGTQCYPLSAVFVLFFYVVFFLTHVKVVEIISLQLQAL